MLHAVRNANGARRGRSVEPRAHRSGRGLAPRISSEEAVPIAPGILLLLLLLRLLLLLLLLRLLLLLLLLLLPMRLLLSRKELLLP